MKILITGARGFIGRNLLLRLQYGNEDLEPVAFDLDTPAEALRTCARACDFVVHLAGVNRPKDEVEFAAGNAGFTGALIAAVEDAGNCAPILMTSSIQAALDNPYGRSKVAAEALLQAHAEKTGAKVHIYRLPNVFGKFSRPNYNSAVATFCHNIARGLPVRVTDPGIELGLVYVDDVVDEILAAIRGRASGVVTPVHRATLGRIVSLLHSFHAGRESLDGPDVGDEFSKKLYATYLSFLPERGFSYALKEHKDARGSFTEFLRTPERGQLSVNVSQPGIVKGNHFHHTKNEKFLVVCGQGVIRFRKPDEGEVICYPVCGDVPTVVDIPPGYTHNIENLGTEKLVTLMWASEPFDPERPDTYYLEV